MYGRFCKACWSLGRGWVDATTGGDARRVLCAEHHMLYTVVEAWVEARFAAPVPEGATYATVACPCGEEHDILHGWFPGNVTRVTCGPVAYSRLDLIDRWVASLFPLSPTMRESLLEDMRADTFTRI